jgi:hypothetical protein
MSKKLEKVVKAIQAVIASDAQLAANFKSLVPLAKDKKALNIKGYADMLRILLIRGGREDLSSNKEILSDLKALQVVLLTAKAEELINEDELKELQAKLESLIPEPPKLERVPIKVQTPPKGMLDAPLQAQLYTQITGCLSDKGKKEEIIFPKENLQEEVVLEIQDPELEMLVQLREAVKKEISEGDPSTSLGIALIRMKESSLADINSAIERASTGNPLSLGTLVHERPVKGITLLVKDGKRELIYSLLKKWLATYGDFPVNGFEPNFTEVEVEKKAYIQIIKEDNPPRLSVPKEAIIKINYSLRTIKKPELLNELASLLNSEKDGAVDFKRLFNFDAWPEVERLRLQRCTNINKEVPKMIAEIKERVNKRQASKEDKIFLTSWYTYLNKRSAELMKHLGINDPVDAPDEWKMFVSDLKSYPNWEQALNHAISGDIDLLQIYEVRSKPKEQKKTWAQVFKESIAPPEIRVITSDLQRMWGEFSNRTVPIWVQELFTKNKSLLESMITNNCTQDDPWSKTVNIKQEDLDGINSVTDLLEQKWGFQREFLLKEGHLDRTIKTINSHRLTFAGCKSYQQLNGAISSREEVLEAEKVSTKTQGAKNKSRESQEDSGDEKPRNRNRGNNASRNSTKSSRSKKEKDQDNANRSRNQDRREPTGRQFNVDGKDQPIGQVYALLRKHKGSQVKLGSQSLNRGDLNKWLSNPRVTGVSKSGKPTYSSNKSR